MSLNHVYGGETGPQSWKSLDCYNLHVDNQLTIGGVGVTGATGSFGVRGELDVIGKLGVTGPAQFDVGSTGLNINGFLGQTGGSIRFNANPISLIGLANNGGITGATGYLPANCVYLTYNTSTAQIGYSTLS